MGLSPNEFPLAAHDLMYRSARDVGMRRADDLAGTEDMSESESYPLCYVYLLGSLSVTDSEGNACTPKAQKSRALLALLALAPRGARSRVWLRDKLWSDRGEEQASASLRQALADLRRSFGTMASKLLISDHHTISLNLGLIQVDALNAVSTQPTDGALDAVPELLEGLDIGDPEFEDWLALERQVWRGRLENALVQRDLTPRPHAVPQQASHIKIPGGSSKGKAPPPTGETNWTVALLPPAIVGEQSDAGGLPDTIAQLLVRSMLETGDIAVADFSSAAAAMVANHDGIGPVALAIQPRYRIAANQIHITICMTRTKDQSLLWMGGTTLDRREVESGDISSSYQFINEAMDRLRQYFLGRLETNPEEATSGESLFGAINAMFRLSRGDLARSEASLRRIIAQRPSAQAYAWFSFLMTFQVGQRFADRASIIEQAQEYGRKSLELDANNSVSLALVGHVHSFLFGEYDFASGLFERAIRVNPTQVLGWDLYSMLQAYAGNPAMGLKMANWARHLGQHSPYRYYFDTSRCINAALAGDHAVAIEAGEQALRERPDFNSLLRYLVASHAQQGDMHAASTMLERLNTVEPDFSVRSLIDARYPIMQTEGGANLIAGLTKAGVKK